MKFTIEEKRIIYFSVLNRVNMLHDRLDDICQKGFKYSNGRIPTKEDIDKGFELIEKYERILSKLKNEV